MTDLQLTAVLDKNLRSLIEEFGLSDSLDSGEILCPGCGKTITFDNIGLLKITDGDVELLCDDYSCLAETN